MTISAARGIGLGPITRLLIDPQQSVTAIDIAKAGHSTANDRNVGASVITGNILDSIGDSRGQLIDIRI